MHVRLRHVVLAAVLGPALVLTGCSEARTSSAASRSRESGADTPSASASASASAGASAAAGSAGPASGTAYRSYVALGDSYTAAPLVPSTDTSNACLRSSGNYPSLVAAAMPRVRLRDVSCSGADSRSLAGRQQTGRSSVPPQLAALGRSTDLVTIGIGGNDANLFGTLVGTCSQLRGADPGGSPCHDRLTAGGQDPLGAALRQIRANVRSVVAAVRARAPHATVVVVGYPQIVPRHGTCPQLPLAAGDYAYGREVNRGLAAAVRAGARGADAYVDVFTASAGHDVCARDPWVNGAQTDPSRALAFHPFAEEQQAVAELVLQAI